MRWLRYLIHPVLHYWSRWSDPYQKAEGSFFNYQLRKCWVCHLTEERMQKLKVNL